MISRVSDRNSVVEWGLHQRIIDVLFKAKFSGGKSHLLGENEIMESKLELYYPT